MDMLYLRARVVELSSLANGEAPRAQDQNLSWWWKPRAWGGNSRRTKALNQPLSNYGGKESHRTLELNET